MIACASWRHLPFVQNGGASRQSPPQHSYRQRCRRERKKERQAGMRRPQERPPVELIYLLSKTSGLSPRDACTTRSFTAGAAGRGRNGYVNSVPRVYLALIAFSLSRADPRKNAATLPPPALFLPRYSGYAHTVSCEQITEKKKKY